ncbi:hypothetical protein BRADI_4g08795v3 [Brachypodium distachyon]|uniref:Knottin scorpion toxin-like domain-containing protein n=1 Tax=Brachypodium distachyon TaxID=15368 RepID=A0A0Q3PCS2_BRADI|nr:hypothetical protein BRADI_4g08795v3 [Brachypodium distachyon]
MEAWRKTTVGFLVLVLVAASSYEVLSVENNCFWKYSNDRCVNNEGCRNACIADGADDGQCRNRAKRLFYGANCECYPKECNKG